MKNETKGNSMIKRTQVLLALAMVVTSCAKKLPVKMETELARDIYSISLLDGAKVVVESTTVGTKKSVAAYSSQFLAKNDTNDRLSFRHVKFVSGDSRISTFFKDFTLESSRKGEKFNITLELSGNFMVAYLDIDNHKISVMRKPLVQNNRAPLFKYAVSEYGIVEQDTNSVGEKTRDLVLRSRSKSESTHVKIFSQVEKRFVIDGLIGSTDEYITNKNEHYDTKATYLYVPMTQGTPRTIADANPFFQGDEKLVKIKFDKNGLGVYELERDLRFRDNPLNNMPVLTIPGSYVDYSCEQDSSGHCSNVGSENKSISWNDKRYFFPKLEELKTLEVNTLDVYVLSGDNCLSVVGTPKVINHTIEKGVINIELEKTYKLNPRFSCIAQNYFADSDGLPGLSRSSFRVRYFYSLVKIENLASKDYKIVDYPFPDHDQFGFFKDEKIKLDQSFDARRRQKSYMLNRWNPENKELVYYLSDSFLKPKNKILRDASFKAVKSINKSLSLAGTDMRIILKDANGKRSGDLRYNVLQLIDNPLGSGLLGYAPSVSNPLTGEIVQAHINMYAGNLISLSRRVWDYMVDFTQEELERSRAINAPKLVDTLPKKGKSSASKINSVKLKSHAANINKSAQGLRNEISKNLSHNPHVKVINEELSELDKQVLKEENRLAHWAENNALSSEAFTIGGTLKHLTPGIKGMKDAFLKNGILKRWTKLTKSQQKRAIDLILPHTYTAALVHEFGHNLGLRHNFAGSFDGDNFYKKEELEEVGLKHIPAYSSIMDYAFSELNELSVFGKYDIAALKFGYARKVEVETKSDDESKESHFVDADIETSLLAFDRVHTRKDYSFCTDGNVGLNANCNRFDEGTTHVEILTHYIEKYKRNYKYSNLRNGRNEFYAENLGRYTVSRKREFNRIRQLFEDFERSTDIFGLEAAMNGCTDIEEAKGGWACKYANDRRDTALMASKFFLDILKTPDHLCAVSSKSKPEAVFTIDLSGIYEEIKHDMNYVPTSCFDISVTKSLLSKSLKETYSLKVDQDYIVRAEAGAFFNGIKDSNPYFPYSNERAVLGVWVDKLLAMKALVQRKSGRAFTESKHMAMIDHPQIAGEYVSFMQHLILGEDLKKPVKFTTESGEKINVPYDIDSDYVVKGPQRSMGPLKRYFGLPKSGDFRLNKALLSIVREFGQSDDLEYSNAAKKVINITAVRKRDIENGFSQTKGLSTIMLDDTYYAAGDNNFFAKMIITTLNGFYLLEVTDKEIIKKVIAIKTKNKNDPDLSVFKLSEDEILGLKFGKGNLEYFSLYLKQNATIRWERLYASEDKKLIDVIKKYYDLKDAEFFNKLIQVKIDLLNAPKDLEDEGKKIWDLAFKDLTDYLDGSLFQKAEGYIDSLKMLNKPIYLDL